MQTRLWYLDILRVVSMAAVVLIHVSAQYWSTTNITSFNWEALNFFDSVARWSVPVFVMISGALFLDPEKPRSIRKLYSKNIARICLIILLWGFIYALFSNPPKDFTIKGLWSFCKVCILGHFHMWFLFVIAGLYVATPILRCIVKEKNATNYFLIATFLINVLIPFITSFGHLSIVADLMRKTQTYTFMGFSFYFVLGYWLSKKDFSSTQVRMGIVAAFFGVICTFVLTAYASLANGKAVETFYSYFSLPVFIAAAGVFVSCRNIRIQNPNLQKVTLVCSKASLGVYLVHILVLNWLQSFGFDSMMFTPLLAVPITSISVIFISFLISVVLYRVPVIGKYLV